MGLSEREQRILDELESQLLTDDPRLARRVANLARTSHGSRELFRAGVLFAVGFVLLLLLTFHPAFGVAGAALMLVALVRGGRAASAYTRDQSAGRESSRKE